MERRRVTPLHRAVRLTARSSALLFASAEAAAAMGPSAARVTRFLYLAFMTVHGIHFTVVARFAVATGGRGLFPGGRSLSDVGGWRTVLAIFGLFAALAVTGWGAVSPGAMSRPRRQAAGRVTKRVIAAMFVGTYAGKVSKSAWYALPASIIGAAAIANAMASSIRQRRGR
jgi:hypothetical protein